MLQRLRFSPLNEIVYKKLMGLYNVKDNFFDKIRFVFHGEKDGNNEDYLEYPHGWVGGHMAAPVLRFNETAHEYNLIPDCSKNIEIESVDAVLFWEFPGIDDPILQQALLYGKKLFYVQLNR